MVVLVTADFQNTSVALTGRELIVRGEIQNRSRTAWHSADGWNTGYHLFDDPSGTLVVDGARDPLDLTPGSQRKFETHVALPAEPGEYSVNISAMQEHVAWFYEKGWPFILIDVSVADDGTAALRRWRIADKN